MTSRVIKKLFNKLLPEQVLDFLSVRDELLLCCSGMSTNDISYLLNLDIEIIKRDLNKYFGFIGLKKTLSYSPLYIYKSLSKSGKISIETFQVVVKENADILFSCCTIFLTLDKELKEYYK